MSGQHISITGKDGNFDGYLSLPPKPGPGVIVIQEIFGVNTWVRTVCDMFSRAGYVALAPDLFWRLKPNVELHPFFQEDFNAGLDYYGKFNAEKGVEDIQAAITTLRGHSACTGKVGTIGFCLGGTLAYLTATRTDADAASSYYGVGIDGLLGESGNIKKPLQLHIAGKDPYVPQEALTKIEGALKGKPGVEVLVYPGLDHGFTRDTDPSHYNAEGTKLAHSRTFEMFKKALA
ncbi:MAG: dienelactone hydrolase family protein [Rhodospirillaceae bacterium]|nr:dienelactone hydrolase family protein [Rhodospirillaceae bacterium]